MLRIYSGFNAFREIHRNLPLPCTSFLLLPLGVGRLPGRLGACPYGTPLHDVHCHEIFRRDHSPKLALASGERAVPGFAVRPEYGGISFVRMEQFKGEIGLL